MFNKNKIFIVTLVILIFSTLFLLLSFFVKYKMATHEENFKQYKKLASCVVPIKVMEKALKEDLNSKKEEKNDVKFSTVISLLAAKYDGEWGEYCEKDVDELILKLKDGEEKELKSVYNNYKYFETFYETLFKEFIGNYKITKKQEKKEFEKTEEKYGLKAYSPIAYGYEKSFCDDFDNEINFAKQKGHYGNDIAVKKGTPFVAVESGVVSECLNEDGLTRLELKSFDEKRTYIYSNCDSKKPFAKGIKKGSVVSGGQLLGFVGDNNCCKKGGAKILRCPYLHFGIKLTIKKNNEPSRDVYVDVFNILKFLEHHKSALHKTEKGFEQAYYFEDEELKQNFKIYSTENLEQFKE